MALMCWWKITWSFADTVTLIRLCDCLCKEFPQNTRNNAVFKTYFDIIFYSKWNIKDNLSFKPNQAEKPPHRTRKYLDILSHLSVSALPLSPAVVENRTAILVLFPTDLNTVAFVYLVMSLVTSKNPNAPWMGISK